MVKVRRASLKVIWWPGGTTRSVVHVTRRPNPSVGSYKTVTIETGHKLPAPPMTKSAI